jgi:hypothetical protein
MDDISRREIETGDYLAKFLLNVGVKQTPSSGYRERQDAQVALQARQQIEYCEQKQRERDDMARRATTVKKATQAAALLEALKFVSVAAGDKDLIETSGHVRLAGNFAVTFDGQLTAGHPIVEELTLCPQIDQLTKALNRSGKSLVIAETPNGRLSIKGERLQAYVACLKPEDMPPALPDPRLGVVDDRIKEAFRCCGTLANENGKRVFEASVLLRANDCTATNGAAILQFWHGIDLPPDMILPKIFCAAVAAVKAKVEGFGASWNDQGRVGSVTFYFEGGAWIKSLCYADEWPNTDPLWWQANFSPVPDGLFEGVDAVADFNEHEFITFAANSVQSHRDANVGAQYEVKGLQPGKQFAGKLMAQVAPWCSSIDLTTYPDRAFFLGGEAQTPVRGIVMCVTESSHEAAEPPPKQDEPTGPFVSEATAQFTNPATTPESGDQSHSPIGQTATTTAYPSEPTDTWGQPVSGWGGEIDDDVEMPE